jgi:anti-anti-sigma factor
MLSDFAGTPSTTQRLQTAFSGETLFVSGEIDAETAPLLYEEIVKDGARSVDLLTIDMSGVTFVDSQGLRALITASELVIIQIANPSTFVRTLLFVTGLEDTFGVG